MNSSPIEAQQTDLSELAIPGYELTSRLAEGGMGTVYLARQTSLGRDVAIKVLSPARGEATSEHYQRFDREVRLMASLRHPHLVPVLDRGHVEQRPWLAMPCYTAGSLRQLMNPEALPDPVELLPQIQQLISALRYLHEQGVIHRDLKPENILVDEFGNLLISDFGVSTLVAELGSLTTTSQTIGSFDYIAPEQRYRLPVTHCADQYSLALVLHEWLSGHRPSFKSGRLNELNPVVNQSTAAVIERALRDDPDERWSDITEFGRHLQAAVESAAPKVSQRGFIAAGVVSLGVSLTFAAGWWLTQQELERIQQKQAALQTLLVRSEETTQSLRDEAASRDAAVVGQENSGTNQSPEAAIPLLEFDPREAVWFVAAGNHLLHVGKADEARACFDACIERFPAVAEAYVGRARVAAHQNRHADAVTDCEAAIRLDPELTVAHVELAWASSYVGNFDRATQAWSKAIELKPDDALYYLHRSNSRRMLHDLAGALDDANRSIELTPTTDAGMLSNRSVVYRELSRYPEALADLRTAAAADPESPDHLYGLAEMLLDSPDASLRNPREALDLATEACSREQVPSARRLELLARCQELTGDITTSISTLDRAMKVADGDYRQRLADERQRLSEIVMD